MATFPSPEVEIRIMLDKIQQETDAEVNNWSPDKVDSSVSELAKTVKMFPNKRQFKKKTVRENNVTFHDGQPVLVVPGGSNVTESFIVAHNLCDEAERFLTYFHYKWPSDAPVSASVLAKAGFFYFGTNLTVQCFSCNGRINNWDLGDTAMGEHKRLYPRCKFVQGVDDRNIPLIGLSDESAKGTSGQQSPKSEHTSSSEDEAGCSDLSELLKPLTLEESKPTEDTQSYFQKELNRLLSFKTWPMSSPVNRFDLAAAGFYCVNDSNGTVQCFACFGRLSNWKLGDVPRSEHRRLFPSCPFIVGVQTGNVSLTADNKDKAVKFFAENSSNLRQPLQISSNLSHSQRFAGQSSSPHRSSLNPSRGTAQSPKSTDLTVKYAKYSKYAYEQARLETYGGWPRNHSQIPANLARAGFFATGNGDEVKCFYCGGGLKDWSIGDDPWEEHSRWFTRCEWLLQQRVPAFVDSVSRKYGPGNHSYFEPNMSVPDDQLAIASPALQPKPQPEPSDVASSVDQEEKKSAEKVEELSQSEIFVEDAGQDEGIINTMVSERFQSGQSPHKTSAELLRATFDAEEEQQRGAVSHQGPDEAPTSPESTSPESIPENTKPDVETEKQKELEEWLRKKLCRRCTEPREVVFLPCHHMVTCKDCSEKLIRCIEPTCNKIIIEKIECVFCTIRSRHASLSDDLDSCFTSE